jgi:sterol desaturase/sphingolipid hydroxylase (fatty acid hydroxylase superfamily)
MNYVLNYLSQLSPAILWLIFLLENVLITLIVLWAGKYIHRKVTGGAISYSYSSRDWQICGLTNILNTVVTYAGYWLWQNGRVVITTSLSGYILLDFLLLFLGMDLLMFIFHYIIHKTFLYRSIHRLHHQSVDPRPVDVFILHPVETVSFGAMWLILLMVKVYNIYAVMIYLAVNVLFGMIGHLGIEPLPVRLRNMPLIKYIGTSTFHHDHHQDVAYNFGFYTSIWDRLSGTYKR